MAKEWIESIAQDIKQNSREAAEEFAREQHRTEVINVQGRIFFSDMERFLEDNFVQIRKLLQNDPTASEITMVTTGATQVRLTRSRFPWFDAHITHQDATVTLEYARDPGCGAAPNSEPKTIIFHFHVAPDDRLSLEEAGTDPPRIYTTPEDMARRITEILFQSESAPGV